ncbi:hypothetical protein K443DRAFT_106913, partial [Laccaria amethystina LaAM-08-1]
PPPWRFKVRVHDPTVPDPILTRCRSTSARVPEVAGEGMSLVFAHNTQLTFQAHILCFGHRSM